MILAAYRRESFDDDPGGTRTHDLAVKSRVLYQLSYRVWATDAAPGRVQLST
jgi:hypothetical protein